MSITIKDIAKELGISYATVSRAINGKKGVSEKSRIAVLEMAERLGYKPNELARGLVSKVSNSIGVIIPDINNPYFGEVVKGILETAKKFGYNVFLCTTDWNTEAEKDYYNALRQKRVDGIILKSADSRDVVDCQVSGNFPLVVIDPNELGDCFRQAEVDNVLGGYMATKYLLDKGYENIAFITGREDRLTCDTRLRGAKKALEEHGKEQNSKWIIEAGFSIEEGRNAMEELFARDIPIDAVFGLNDLIALGILQSCAEHRKRVPEDIAVMGYDDIPYASLPQIQLTTVNQPKYQLGCMAFKLLLNEIQANKGEKISDVKLTPKIIQRKTTKEQ